VKFRRILIVFLILPLALSAWVPPPLQGPGNEFFAETGHNVSGDFLLYYRSIKNAQSIFGFPITEQFVRNGVAIQYFQRARFELHPELPVGQRVTLSDLGKEMLETGQRIRIFNPFACRYYRITGFSVCYSFLDFFKKSGGVAVFGNPISPAQKLNDTTIVQYFEKARFEWHPALAEGQRVRITDLGRLYFDRIKEDANLLRPVLSNASPGATTLISLELHAFAAKALTLSNDQQTISVIAQDQVLNPVSGASGTAVIHWAGGVTQAIAFTTDTKGIGTIPLAVVNQPYGTTVTIDITVTKSGVSSSTTTSFRVWY